MAHSLTQSSALVEVLFFLPPLERIQLQLLCKRFYHRITPVSLYSSPTPHSVVLLTRERNNSLRAFHCHERGGFYEQLKLPEGLHIYHLNTVAQVDF